MLKIISLTLLLFAFNARALDLDQYKERIRSHMAKMLGEETTSKLLGKGQNSGSVKLPPIPQVSLDATSTEIYNQKNREIDFQGADYDKLALEEKRKYRVAFIQEIYQVTRNSQAKEGDIVKFLNVLEQGGSREGVYRAVTLDSIYATLESYEEVPEKALSDFALKYGEKYLARRFDRGSMEKLNLWSIKRIITEKTLELMDVLANQPEDLRSWYAVLSAQLAQERPEIWKNKVRAHPSDAFHLEWAKKAPLQHIKSETIIKLHKTMNFLNETRR